MNIGQKIIWREAVTHWAGGRVHHLGTRTIQGTIVNGSVSNLGNVTVTVKVEKAWGTRSREVGVQVLRRHYTLIDGIAWHRKHQQRNTRGQQRRGGKKKVSNNKLR